MKTGIELISREREEQLTKHGRTIEKDFLENNECQLMSGAVELITLHIAESLPINWNDDLCVKICNKSYKERLVIAGALIAAEIDRLNYIEENKL